MSLLTKGLGTNLLLTKGLGRHKIITYVINRIGHYTASTKKYIKKLTD